MKIKMYSNVFVHTVEGKSFSKIHYVEFESLKELGNYLDTQFDCNAKKFGFVQVNNTTAMHLVKEHDYDVLPSSNVRSGKMWVRSKQTNNKNLDPLFNMFIEKCKYQTYMTTIKV